MKKLEAMKDVYTYFYPEVRSMSRFGEKLPDELYLTTTTRKRAEELLNGLFKVPLEIPKTPDGKFSLDKIHEPIIDRVVSAYKSFVPALDDFYYKYPMAGSSQGIFHLLSQLKTEGIENFYVLKGEYGGYGEYAKTIGLKSIEIDPERMEHHFYDSVDPGVWFISNPSARDGNIIPNKFINDLCEMDHKVILDFSYLGLTRNNEFDIEHENVIATLMSFSKPYGMFRFRVGGFTYSRKEIPSLYANSWFKDIPGIFTAAKLVEDLPPGTIYENYKEKQGIIIDKINKDFDLNIRRSDSILLGYMKNEDVKGYDSEKLRLIEPFKRGDGYRFCITPYYEKLEKEGSI